MEKARKWLTTLGILLVLACAGVSICADGYADEESTARAQELFDEAAADYMAKRWDLAAVKFRKAYSYLPEALFLYNQAKALQKLDNHEVARGALIRARDQKERSLPPEIAAKVPAFLAELDASLAELEAQKKEGAVGVDVVATTDSPLEKEEEFGVFGWIGVGGLAAGSGLMIFGGLLAADISEESERLKTESGQTPEQFQSDRQAAQSDQDTARLVFYSGAGLALLGTGLVAWEIFSIKGEARGEPRAHLRLGVTSVAWEATW